MSALLRLAWRNLWRSPRRTLLTLAAIGLGVMALVSVHSFREVANAGMIDGVTRGLVGHAQIHGLGYQASPELENGVAEPGAVLAVVRQRVPTAEVERRVVGAGLAGAGEASAPVTVLGVEPAAAVAQGLYTVEQGRSLGEQATGEAVIGRGLGRELGVGPGGELVLVGQAADGSLANDRFTIVGLADAGSLEANATSVFLALDEAQSFFALGERVHQIVLRLPGDGADPTEAVASLRGALDPAALEVLPWTEILPELKGAMDAKRKNQHLLDVIVILIVSLGVLNTMTMATFERTREFGVMASLGTRRRRILGMVLLEAALLGVAGFGLGLALAAALLYGMSPFELASLTESMDVMGARMPERLWVDLHPYALGSAAVTVAVTVLVGGTLPALRASRHRPAEATRVG